MNNAPTVVPTPDREAVALTRQGVRDLLTSNPAFQALPPEQQRAIAHNTVQVASYLAAPEGIRGNELATVQALPALAPPLATPLAGGGEPNISDVRKISDSRFSADAAREGAAVAGALLREVNFPTFVASLIQGVFHAIVEASIEQMEAYGKLVADVAKTLNQFRDENVSPNQGRDHLVNMFPEVFAIGVNNDPFGGGFGFGSGGRGEPRVMLREGVDEDAALKRVQANLPVDGGISSLDDDTIEGKLVPAARTQLATSRQQLLATMVLMGINRIVVTEGKISAKVMYDFQARDTRRFQRSAVAYDYAKEKNPWGGGERLATMTTTEGEYDNQFEGGERNRSRQQDGSWSDEQRDGSFYSKGKYKTTEAPVVKAMSAAAETTDAALQTRASLAGVVDINFKSDYFPLEKMADSFQIGMIQNAARPGQGRPAPAGGGQPAPAAGNTQSAPATGGAQPTATPAPRT